MISRVFGDHCGITMACIFLFFFFFNLAPLYEGIADNLRIVSNHLSPWIFKPEIASKRKTEKECENNKWDHHEITRDHHGSSFFR